MSNVIKMNQKVYADIVQVRHKNVYGKELIYPANESAEIFCKLTQKKTLDNHDLALIKALGYRIEQVI